MPLEEESRSGVFTSLLILFDGTVGTIITLVLVPILFFLVLWLPPISLGERIFDVNYFDVPPTGGIFTAADGAELMIPPDALASEELTKVQFSKAPRQAFIDGTVTDVTDLLQDAPAALPPQLLIKSPVYLARIKGEIPLYSIWTLPIPDENMPLGQLDLYTWDGSAWSWLPHQLWAENALIETRTAGIPLAVALMQSQGVRVEVGAVTDEEIDFINQAGSSLSILSPRLYLLQGEGNIGQIFTPSPILQQSGAFVIPVLHNIEPSGIIRSDLIDNLLIDASLWPTHIELIEGTVVRNEYDGIMIDYREIDPLLRDEFSQFIMALGERMAMNNKSLVVRVNEPLRISDDEFDTGAYNWQVIGQVSSSVQVPVPRTAGLFAGSDDLDALLLYATSHIDRYKLKLELPIAPYAIEDGKATPVMYGDILQSLNLPLDNSNEATSQTINLSLEALEQLEEITVDPSTGSYRLTIDGRDVYVENAATLSRRLERVSAYHVGGVTVVEATYADPNIWPIMSDYVNRSR